TLRAGLPTTYRPLTMGQVVAISVLAFGQQLVGDRGVDLRRLVELLDVDTLVDGVGLLQVARSEDDRENAAAEHDAGRAAAGEAGQARALASRRLDGVLDFAHERIGGRDVRRGTALPELAPEHASNLDLELQLRILPLQPFERGVDRRPALLRRQVRIQADVELAFALVRDRGGDLADALDDHRVDRRATPEGIRSLEDVERVEGGDHPAHLQDRVHAG